MTYGLLMNFLLVAVGGALGASSRFAVSVFATKALGQEAFYATFFVNVLGSFLMGFLFIMLFNEKTGGMSIISPLVLTGFLGGFTTFSAFSLDTVRLFERGDVGLATTYILGSVFLSIGALCLGLWMAKGL